MLSAERAQLSYDFGLAPRLVRRYIPEEERSDSLKTVRQVNGVTTYLSQMACDEVRHVEAVYYAVAIAAIDAVTDYRGERLSDGLVQDALNGEWGHPELEAVHVANEFAKGPRFKDALLNLSSWQDESLKQFDNPSEQKLLEITRGKGGYSALGHLHAMKENPTDAEDQLMMDFGFAMQLLDDYLDKQGDRASGISTLFTRGVFDRRDLFAILRTLQSDAADVWGDSPELRRFFRVCRAHARLGDLENGSVIPVKRIIPFYF